MSLCPEPRSPFSPTNSAITPHFFVQACPRCEVTPGREAGFCAGVAEACRLCGGSQVLRVNQFTGAVTAVEIPAAD